MYLNLTQASKHANVCARTLRRWFQRGLPHYQVGRGGKILLKASDIDQFLIQEQKEYGNG